MQPGIELKVERVRARVTATEIADAMGVSRQRVSQIEAMPGVNPTLERRYRSALLQVTEGAQNAVEAVG